jgi:hypothetical protein
VSLIDPADYYADRDVQHSAQGDIHVDLPFRGCDRGGGE